MDTAANPTRPTEMPTALHKQGGWGRSAAQPPGPPLGAPAGRPQPPRGNARRRGFTLTELLVVIAIIAVLAALVTVAAVRALQTAKRTRISTEISELSRTLEDFKTKYQVYPPNGMNDGSTGPNGSLTIATNDFVRMFKKAFPRSKENPNLIRAIAGENVGGGITTLQNGIWASEAIYFWLGGFSDDPEYPISGQGGPSFSDSDGNNNGNLDPADEILENRNRAQGYEFDLTRLVPRVASGPNEGTFDTSNNRFITYPDPRNGETRQINFWQYAPSGFKQPFVYFDTSRHKPYEYDMPAAPGVSVYALEKLREGVNSANSPSDLIFANQDKFQILHAGIDDAWGEGYPSFSYYSVVVQNSGNLTDVYTYPDGPFVGEMADNLANFVSGTLADAQEE